MKYFKFRCLYCGQHMECDPKHCGRQVKCPSCHHKMVIPSASGKREAISVNETWDVRIPSPEVSTPTRYR